MPTVKTYEEITVDAERIYTATRDESKAIAVLLIARAIADAYYAGVMEILDRQALERAPASRTVQ